MDRIQATAELDSVICSESLSSAVTNAINTFFVPAVIILALSTVACHLKDYVEKNLYGVYNLTIQVEMCVIFLVI